MQANFVEENINNKWLLFFSKILLKLLSMTFKHWFFSYVFYFVPKCSLSNFNESLILYIFLFLVTMSETIEILWLSLSVQVFTLDILNAKDLCLDSINCLLVQKHLVKPTFAWWEILEALYLHVQAMTISNMYL